MMYTFDYPGLCSETIEGYKQNVRNTAPAGKEIFNTYHEAKKAARAVSQSHCVYTIGCGKEWDERDGRFFLKEPQAMYPAAVVYAVSSVSTVKMDAKIICVHPRDVDKLKQARLGEAEFDTAWNEIWTRHDESAKPYRASLEGLCRSLEDAIYLAKKNNGDMNEAGWNQYVVVEEIPVGWWPDSAGVGTRWFLEWKQIGEKAGEGKYVMMDKPPAVIGDENNYGCYAFYH